MWRTRDVAAAQEWYVGYSGFNTKHHKEKRKKRGQNQGMVRMVSPEAYRKKPEPCQSCRWSLFCRS